MLTLAQQRERVPRNQWQAVALLPCVCFVSHSCRIAPGCTEQLEKRCEQTERRLCGERPGVARLQQLMPLLASQVQVCKKHTLEVCAYSQQPQHEEIVAVARPRAAGPQPYT